MTKIIFATGNKDKLREIKEILSDCDVDIRSMKEAGINVDIVEDGIYSLLRQYRTASGYGYKNPVFDLRGKGQEAVLTTLSDGSRLALKEKNK